MKKHRSFQFITLLVAGIGLATVAHAADEKLAAQVLVEGAMDTPQTAASYGASRWEPMLQASVQKRLDIDIEESMETTLQDWSERKQQSTEILHATVFQDALELQQIWLRKYIRLSGDQPGGMKEQATGNTGREVTGGYLREKKIPYAEKSRAGLFMYLPGDALNLAFQHRGAEDKGRDFFQNILDKDF